MQYMSKRLQRKSKVIQLRMTAEKKLAWDAQARKTGKSMTEYIIDIVDEKIREEKLVNKIENIMKPIQNINATLQANFNVKCTECGSIGPANLMVYKDRKENYKTMHLCDFCEMNMSEDAEIWKYEDMRNCIRCNRHEIDVEGTNDCVSCDSFICDKCGIEIGEPEYECVCYDNIMIETF